MWAFSTFRRSTEREAQFAFALARDAELQVGGLDRVARDERRRAFEEVLELAHVAGERIVEKRLHGVARERGRAAAVARGDAREKVPREARNVLAVLAQRGHADLDDAQPVEEVLAEAPGADLGGQVLMRRRDDAHVDGHLRAPADALDLALLQDPQELGLDGERRVADLVEEDRAAVRELELAEPRLDARRDAALDAEELALEEALGDGRAVEREEGALAARRARVQKLRRELLAGAALARDEDVDARRGRPGDELLGAPHRRRVAHEDLVHAEAALERTVLLPEAVEVGGERPEASRRLERRRDEARERDEEPAVLLVEGRRVAAPRLAVEDHEHAEHAASREERDSRHALDGAARGPSLCRARATSSRARGRGRTDPTRPRGVRARARARARRPCPSPRRPRRPPRNRGPRRGPERRARGSPRGGPSRRAPT